MASSLPSPPVSAASPSTSLHGAANASSELPIARRHPLRPGSQKEISLISYIDDKLLRVQRRYGKKFSSSGQEDDDAPGYNAFDEVLQDVEPLIDLAWVSGTPSLQIPYLLTLAGTLVSYLLAFPFSASTFRVLKKIDQGFVKLLRTQSPAGPHGAETSVVSRTEKVRIKSLAEDTRVAVVNVASRNGHATTIQDISSDDNSDDDDDDDEEEDDDDQIGLGLGRVYGRTLEILGDELT